MRQAFKQISFLCSFLLTINIAIAQQSIIGQWKTIDDETKQARSIVELSIKNNKLYGKIVKLFPRSDETGEALCKKCKGSLKNQPILGMQIINGLSLEDGRWQDGKILDPNNGKFYSCKIWLENRNLKVRGYIGFFFRTQQWLRYNPSSNQPPIMLNNSSKPEQN